MSLGWRWGRRAPPAGAASRPDWQQANPRSIRLALDRAAARPTGGWFVLDASRRVGRRPRGFLVDGREVVAWRQRDGGVQVAPGACPHMGASLDGAPRRDDCLVCPWHGLELGPGGHGPWRPLPAHDDGVLTWVQLPSADPLPAPVLPARPAHFIDGVIRVEARCAPEDVIANRLDPWHGGHFHPYSFGALEVVEETDAALTVRVEKLVLGPLRVEVEATFHCPDARTIVMTIVDGEGLGSVVETHATPMDAGRTAIVEATLASSQRPGFRHARRIARLVRPFIERSARRLWVDDAAYAERLYQLRHGAG